MKDKIILLSIISILLLASCRTTKYVIPAPKYTTGTFYGLEVKQYQSSIDTSMNYLEDLFEVFPEHNK